MPREKKQKPAVVCHDGSDAEVSDAEVQQLLQSGAWKALTQEGTGRTYYYHAETKKTCWDLKKELLKQRRAQAKEKAAAATTAQEKESMATEKEEQGQTEASDAGHAEAERSAAAAPTGPGVAAGNQHVTLPKTTPPTSPTEDASISGNVNKRRNDLTSGRDDNNHPTLLPFGEKGRELMQMDTYKDPLQRLMDETNSLERLMVSSGTSQAMALEFQRSYEALTRTNRALTTQMVKMKQEYGAMEMALREANIKLYEKDLALRELQCRTRAVDKEDEAERTLIFLREQNQELIRQVGELTVVLSRGFNELAYQQALTSGPGALNPEQLASSPLQLNQNGSLGTMLDRVLTNPVTHKLLCLACTEELEKLRLSLLSDEERTTTSLATVRHHSTTGTGGDHYHHARYVPADSAALPFNHLGHPEEVTQAGKGSGCAGGGSGPFQPPQETQRRPQYGPQVAVGAKQLSLSPRQNSAASHPHSGSDGGLQSYPYRQQLPGSAYSWKRWTAQADDGRSSTYGDHIPKVSMSRRSESQNLAVSPTPIFGGFRIRPSY
ncbi:hypothetical protein TraAM80_03799 [Trypanosoma rangeli]|uniref:WW domain-containing protein n=1 Tax=Trypanosoma rangeli TaxID=5698 RepID=A0A422NN75_TRYRA|nr:uncharacterized protein TraAM80_03799 [Trypanosoma rangeli]RNF06854.1 hypothetical protein TraAM80_03799 [Trypanosoma rangeli]|eukprot:RNF06854.1 hypothetical protein TraAM80_03799 [Trypanosoma rangeli]